MQDLRDKPWRNEELKNLEEDLSRLIKCDLETAARNHKAMTGEKCDDFDPKVSLSS